MTQLSRQRSGGADQILAWFDAEPARILSRCCLFLDVDGTLIEFKDDPRSAVGDPELTALLQSAEEKFGGALALVSGRLLATLDEMLKPLRVSASGLYGFERRDPKGVVHRRMASVRALDAARQDGIDVRPAEIQQRLGAAQRHPRAIAVDRQRPVGHSGFEALDDTAHPAPARPGPRAPGVAAAQ